MKTLLITDVRIYNYNDDFYAKDAFFRILERYCNCFQNVTLATRIIKVSTIKNDFIRITELPKRMINLESITNVVLKKNNQGVKRIIEESDLIILRLPSLISMELYGCVKKSNKKYLAEVMGCAWDAYWNHGLIGKIIAPFAFFKMKKILRKAPYAIYVTNEFLQKRYPCTNTSIGISNVNITDIVETKDYYINKKSISLMTAAAVNVKYKGQQYVIRALKRLKKKGIYIEYYLAGGGSNKYLSFLSKKCGVEDQVHFLGSLKHDELIKWLDKIDIYIQPSLQEGLPRSVIEAMSRGCVCLGTTTAGIPELLNPEQLFKRRSVNSIVKAIEKNINYDFDEISKNNIQKSKAYLADTLNKKRNNFYNRIMEEIEKR